MELGKFAGYVLSLILNFQTWQKSSNQNCFHTRTANIMHYVIQLFAYLTHDDIIKWKHFPRYWALWGKFHNGQWRRALMFSLFYAWTNDCVNNRGAGDLRRYHAHYDVTVMHVIFVVCKLNTTASVIIWTAHLCYCYHQLSIAYVHNMVLIAPCTGLLILVWRCLFPYLL